MKQKKMKTKRIDEIRRRRLNEAAYNLDPDAFESLNDLVRGHHEDLRSIMTGRKRTREAVTVADTLVSLLGALTELGIENLPAVKLGDSQGAYSVFEKIMRNHIGDIRWVLDMTNDRAAAKEALTIATTLMTQLHRLMNSSSQQSENNKMEGKKKMIRIKLSELKQIINSEVKKRSHKKKLSEAYGDRHDIGGDMMKRGLASKPGTKVTAETAHETIEQIENIAKGEVPYDKSELQACYETLVEFGLPKVNVKVAIELARDLAEDSIDSYNIPHYEQDLEYLKSVTSKLWDKVNSMLRLPR